MNDFASKMYLFGVGSLLSMNYYQASIYQAIFTYFTLACVIMVLALNVLQVTEKILNIGYLIFYFILFCWYMGIMIDYFITWKNS